MTSLYVLLVLLGGILVYRIIRSRRYHQERMIWLADKKRTNLGIEALKVFIKKKEIK